MKIYAVLFLFFGLYLSVCIWIFLIVTASFRKISLHGFFRVNRDFIETVDGQMKKLSGNESIAGEQIRELCGKMKNAKMKRYFLKRFIYFADKIKDKNLIREYFHVAFPYVVDSIQCDRKMHYSEKSYRIMLLGEFRQDRDEINELMLRALDNESFDVRTNALRSLSLIGNADSFNRGLIKACCSDKYFNTRHITEMTECFEGDKQDLRQLMEDHFFDNSDSYRYQVLVFLTTNTFCDAMDFVLDYFKNHHENKENSIACLRFFASCDVNELAKENLLHALQEEDVELRAVSVKLTPKYFRNDGQIVRLLSGEGYLKSGDWYVRRNSAAALTGIGLEKEEILELLPSDDRYAREALVYAMFDAGYITYQDFIDQRGDIYA